MKYIIKNMISERCKMIVKSELENLGLSYIAVELGEVELIEKMSADTEDILKNNLQKTGLELVDDKTTTLINNIKNAIIEILHNAEKNPKLNFSTYLYKRLGYQYSYMANTFSKVEGITISQYIIIQKIEKIKEMILNSEFNLSEIASIMKFSSQSHLTKLFKKITGLTPSEYKREKSK